jgi:hypothetical protein
MMEYEEKICSSTCTSELIQNEAEIISNAFNFGITFNPNITILTKNPGNNYVRIFEIKLPAYQKYILSFVELKLINVIPQNNPNPFRTTTTIRFSLPQNSYVTLKVYDSLGRKIASLVDGELNPGEHSVVYNSEGLPSGVYFYRLQAGKFVQQRKMVVVR